MAPRAAPVNQAAPEMPVVSVGSPKGGVGKTTLAASVAVALHREGWRVLAIDLDRQNALRLHFEIDSDDLPGIAGQIEGARDWTDLVVETPSGVYLIPYGDVTAAGGLQVEAYAARHPDWIRGQLEPFFDYPDVIVIADMPPGPSTYTFQVDPVADLQIGVLLADAMSLALVPKLQAGDFLLPDAEHRPARVGYVLNQVEPWRQLSRDVVALAQGVLVEDLYGTVHYDDAVAEAVACQLTVLDYAPDSAASRDILNLAQRVHRTLTAA